MTLGKGAERVVCPAVGGRTDCLGRRGVEYTLYPMVPGPFFRSRKMIHRFLALTVLALLSSMIWAL